MQPDRHSYRNLLELPAWGLFNGEELTGSVRAETAHDAINLFAEFNERHPDVRMLGNFVKKLDDGL
jgi:hypothetical protein